MTLTLTPSLLATLSVSLPLEKLWMWARLTAAAYVMLLYNRGAIYLQWTCAYKLPCS